MTDKKNHGAMSIDDIEQSVVDVAVTPDKPFNECFTCRYLRNGCSGPNLMAMHTDRMWEFLEIVRKKLGLTYNKIAESTGISPTNVKLNMTGQVKNPSLDTVRAIASFLVGDPKGKYPCALHLVMPQKDMSEEVEKLLGENKELRQQLTEEKVKKDFILRDWEFKRDRIVMQDKIILRLLSDDDEV